MSLSLNVAQRSSYLTVLSALSLIYRCIKLCSDYILNSLRDQIKSLIANSIFNLKTVIVQVFIKANFISVYH